MGKRDWFRGGSPQPDAEGPIGVDQDCRPIQPDYGTARYDFPGGSPGALFDSIRGLHHSLPASTRVFTYHDDRSGGRPLAFASTLAEQDRANVQLNAGTTREEFVTFPTKRDARLAMPRLMLPAIHLKVRAGELREPESNARCYLKLPFNAFGRKARPCRRFPR